MSDYWGEETEKTEVKLIVFGIILVNLQDNMAKRKMALRTDVESISYYG